MVTEALQFNQLSLEEFCIILLSRVVTMFQGPLCTDSATIESAVNLLHKVLRLMTKVFPDDLWRSGIKLNSLMVSEDDTSTCIIMHVVILLKITGHKTVLAGVTFIYNMACIYYRYDMCSDWTTLWHYAPVVPTGRLWACKSMQNNISTQLINLKYSVSGVCTGRISILIALWQV